jgi:hypothetical protein
MQKFKSHKVVEAAKITKVEVHTGSAVLHFGNEISPIEVSESWFNKHYPVAEGYLVRYADGYLSFSPAKAFEEGYTAVDAYPTPAETLTTGQPKITGYRNLSQDEISLMNDIKALGGKIDGHIAMVRSHLRTQAAEVKTSEEQVRIDFAEPMRWLAMSRTDFQTALMKLARAVAQPTTF